ncbi:THO complex, subunit 5 [Carpediemonas membranifera]|uniref:THO complex, subunit 5 n=1 Tax=Carpediemonas membranifera TaxID=201153 RepID=A0A8J6AU59_9EUKA|nr:THO complex, subunit 5 [Carpediemonas membranifera]|eukprot:KAG9391650.1 THO complex, subunit 5 [Carpediemonas membranifera]
MEASELTDKARDLQSVCLGKAKELEELITVVQRAFDRRMAANAPISAAEQRQYLNQLFPINGRLVDYHEQHSNLEKRFHDSLLRRNSNEAAASLSTERIQVEHSIVSNAVKGLQVESNHTKVVLLDRAKYLPPRIESITDAADVIYKIEEDIEQRKAIIADLSKKNESLAMQVHIANAAADRLTKAPKEVASIITPALNNFKRATPLLQTELTLANSGAEDEALKKMVQPLRFLMTQLMSVRALAKAARVRTPWDFTVEAGTIDEDDDDEEEEEADSDSPVEKERFVVAKVVFTDFSPHTDDSEPEDETDSDYDSDGKRRRKRTQRDRMYQEQTKLGDDMRRARAARLRIQEELRRHRTITLLFTFVSELGRVLVRCPEEEVLPYLIVPGSGPAIGIDVLSNEVVAANEHRGVPLKWVQALAGLPQLSEGATPKRCLRPLVLEMPAIISRSFVLLEALDALADPFMENTRPRHGRPAAALGCAALKGCPLADLIGVESSVLLSPYDRALTPHRFAVPVASTDFVVKQKLSCIVATESVNHEDCAYQYSFVAFIAVAPNSDKVVLADFKILRPDGTGNIATLPFNGQRLAAYQRAVISHVNRVVSRSSSPVVKKSVLLAQTLHLCTASLAVGLFFHGELSIRRDIHRLALLTNPFSEFAATGPNNSLWLRGRRLLPPMEWVQARGGSPSLVHVR